MFGYKDTIIDNEKIGEYRCVGYIGKVSKNGHTFFLGDAGSQSLHEQGCFITGSSLSDLKSYARCYAPFSNEQEVKDAFKMKYDDGYTLEKILKVEYYEGMKIVE